MRLTALTGMTPGRIILINADLVESVEEHAATERAPAFSTLQLASGCLHHVAEDVETVRLCLLAAEPVQGVHVVPETP